RGPATRARICALMEPTSDPTYSTEIGTSRSTTDSTFTTAGRGGAVARDASPPHAGDDPPSPAEIAPPRSPTDSTFTTAGGGVAVAREASPQPAAAIATGPISETTSSPRRPEFNRATP